MTREELFRYIQQIDDPKKDFGKILANLHYTHFSLMDKYRKVFSSYDLTLTQFNVLSIIVSNYPKPLTLEEVKSMVLEPNSDVSRTVDRLVEKGFVRKKINKTNRRKVGIQATAKGVKISKKIENDPKFYYFTQDIKLTEAKAFIKTLAKLRLKNL